MTKRARPRFLPAGIPLLAFVLVFLAVAPLQGAQGLTLPPNGENPQASVMQAIGPVRVTTGDRKKALAEAKLALAQAPDDPNKKSLERTIEQLEAGKDIN